MDALTVDRQISAIRKRTARLGVWSLVVHAAALVAFLAVAHEPPLLANDDFDITEITWVETEETAPEPVVVAQPEPEEPVVVQETPSPAPVIPPRNAAVDLLQQRLATLRDDDTGRRAVTAAATVNTPTRAAPATLGAMVPRPDAAKSTLSRATDRPVARAAELTKAKPTVVAAAVTRLPAADRESEPTPAQEILPGVSLAGEVSNRRLMDYTTPEYPEWAKRSGVEVSVELYFTVLPSGRLKENLLVERTSGYDDFDRRAREALARWRFESLGPGTSAEQWGRIEFKYRLRDAG
ncbi:MAG: TonB family protein [bacterium]|nr:TonB family protein [bacterium]